MTRIKLLKQFFHTRDKGGLTYQYGVPMKDFLFAKVADIWAETPKSAGERQRAGVRVEFLLKVP